MRYLLDTHVFLWWLFGNEQISRKARQTIEKKQGEIIVSAASAWEAGTKKREGKLSSADEAVENFAHWIANQEFIDLPVTITHAQRASLLPGEINDPFDRMLIAQAQADNLVIVSDDKIFDNYGVRRIW